MYNIYSLNPKDRTHSFFHVYHVDNIRDQFVMIIVKNKMMDIKVTLSQYYLMMCLGHVIMMTICCI
jgi:hypothetical protein